MVINITSASNISASVMQQISDAQEMANSALTKANVAEGTGQNARQMVLNRDTKITSLEDAMAALQTATQALQQAMAAVPKISMGSTVVGAALLAGATRDVTVPLTLAMPTDAYQVGAWIGGSTSILGQTLVVGVVSKTKTAVVIQIKNTGLTSILASLLTVQVLAVGTA